MKKFAESIVKYRWLIIITTLVLTIVLGYQITSLKINSDLISSLPDDDPAASLYKKVGTQFGGNDMGMVVLETDDIFNAEVLQHVKQITDSIKITHGISTVTSITNIIDIKNDNGGIDIGRLVDEYNLPNSKAQLDSLKAYVFSKDMFKGAIASDDGTATLIMFTILNDANKQVVARNVKEKIEALNLPEKLYFGGLPMMMNDISDLIVADIIWLLPLVFLLIAFVLLLSFRSATGVILPLLTAGIAVVWTLGIMVLAGYELTMISNEMPIIILAIGSAYTIHVLNRINQTKNGSNKANVTKALSFIYLPVFLAAATTAIGFVSFIFGSYLTMIRDFGIFTSLGIAFSLILSLTFIPAIIAALPANRKKGNYKTEIEKKSLLSDKALKPLVSLLFKHPKYTLTAWSVLIVLSIVGMSFIKTSVNMADYFKKDNPTRVSEDIMQKKFGGSLPVFVVFKGDMQTPDVLKTMKKAETYMKQFPDITTTQSVADLIEEMNNVMGEGKKIPDEKAKIEQLWFLLDGQDIMPQLVSANRDEGIIQSKFASVESKSMTNFVKYMDKFIKENSTDNCKIEITGMPSVYEKLNNSLLQSQFSSLVLAIIMVLLIVGIMMRSYKQGVYATIPIISTVAILFGFMGFTGISLDIVTVLVASVTLGIGIDYSIHIISHYNHLLRETGDINIAIEDTIIKGGKAVVINVISVAAGFLVLLFSQIVPLQNFGILLALSMVGSGLGSLTLLPVILILSDRKKQNIKS
ncbi:MAG: MMPL family transporter [Vicingaceae bacterium]|nr:MMPL family transporter [Vicingaceae bacterium]